MSKIQKRSCDVCTVANARRHSDKGSAKRAAKLDSTLQKNGIVPHVYKCKHCSGWHYEGSR